MTWAWYYAPGTDPETFSGPCATREEAVDEGRFAVDADEAFTVIEARKGTLINRLPSADQIIDMILERADEEGDFGDADYPELTGTQADRERAETSLKAALQGWFNGHASLFPEPWAFAETRNMEVLYAPQGSKE